MDSPAHPGRGHEAYARVREAIRDGTLPPGVRLTETDLAARFGVSRTPIRQAIARLEAEGLLTHEPRRGLAVSRPDHAQVVELYVMREILEGAAARLAAQHASETEIAAMEELVAGEPASFADAPKLAAVNQRLHGLLYLAAHNRYLLRSLEQLSATMALLPSLLTIGGRAQQAHEEHLVLAAALRARDGAAAEEAARRHSRAAQRQRLAWLVQVSGVPMAAPGG
ncbi:GntR family transcriptional regulator [Roseococcus sp. SYP-B2431]|uniref:GntR family transcriptional regulator n=1 Tax=Roseococcus sp. SYP-B2431 TaxID=2496640 RepID=UPI00104054FF|nr:GntR family transcriptional regulator [Roseococcus sp. SYP-B2431]TCH96359.1 GntR family transcriptional regulator [Roseococcus sp. SYP-B2431]